MREKAERHRTGARAEIVMAVVQMKDVDHLLMADPHRQEARAEGHQKEEAALQEQEAAGHHPETPTGEAEAGEIVHHPEDEAVHQADVDAEKVVLLRTDDIEIDRASKK